MMVPTDEQPETYDAAHQMVDRLRAGVQDDKERVAAVRSFWRELPVLVIIALLVAVLIKTFLFQAFHIPSGSMRNTLLEGDRIMVNKLSYNFGDVEHGDIVVFNSPFLEDEVDESLIRKGLRNVAEAVGLRAPKHDFIKRVVGVAGDTVEIRGGVVLVNGLAIDEPYLHPSSTMRPFGPLTVSANSLFVMGDNRNASQDSRFFGEIPIDGVVGRAFVILWPVDRWGGL